MNEISAFYLHRAETWLFISTLFYFLMNGAGIFETVVLIPKWTKSPPQSLKMLNQIDLKTFWIVMHSIHDITFILAIIFCWEFELIRNSLIIFFSIHFAVRVWTILYFAPRIMKFQEIAISGVETPGLQKQITRWKNLNYLRTGLFIIVSVLVAMLNLHLFWRL